MRHTLSSPLTIFWKFAFPTGLIGGWAYVHVMALRGKFTPVSAGEFALEIVLSVVVLGWLVWWAASLKRVAVDDHTLYVSNYVTEVRIPLVEVTSVRESGSRRYFTVDIELRNSTALGKRVVFRPRFRLYWSGIHPIVRELQALCARARGEKRRSGGSGVGPLP